MRLDPTFILFPALSIQIAHAFLVQRSKLTWTKSADVPARQKSSAKSGSSQFLSNNFSLRMVKDDYDSEDEEVDIEEPLSKGIDSVKWLPSVNEKQRSEELKDAEVLPMFPLGGIVYTPNSNHVLNIFEPRYRQMYNDILMNGSKRFVVTMSHPESPGKFAEIGVVFHLEDLKEVSEMTADRVKYICDHKVTGRVKVHRILNPEAWKTRDTYLKVEGTLLNDNEMDESLQGKAMDIYSQVASVAGMDTDEERALKKVFTKLVNLQHELQEDVRFTKASAASLKIKPGTNNNSLWETVRLWQAYSDNRLQARQNELQQEFQAKLLKYLTDEKKMKENEIPSAIDFSSLSPQLQKDVQELQKRMAMELQPLILESTLTLQKILEAKSHKDRVNLVRYFVEAEIKRLEAKKLLKGMFKASDKTTLSSILQDSKPTAAMKEDIPVPEKIKDSLPTLPKDGESDLGGSAIFDDPNAFQ